MISDLNRLSATEPFPSIGFQIINEVSLTDDSPPRQWKRHHRLWHQLRRQRAFSMPSSAAAAKERPEVECQFLTPSQINAATHVAVAHPLGRMIQQVS
jgi:hypothetical protein